MAGAESEMMRRELQELTGLLEKKQQSYTDTSNNLKEAIKKKKVLCEEIKAEIHVEMEKMVQKLRKKEEEFLTEIEKQHEQEVQDAEKKLQETDNTLKKITASKQMVEAFMYVHPTIPSFLENLKEPPDVGPCGLVEEKKQFQAWFERVTGVIEDAPSQPEMIPRKERSGKAPEKRQHVAEERATESPPKVVRICREENEEMAELVSHLQAEPGTSFQSAGSTLNAENTSNLKEYVTNDQCGEGSSSMLSHAGPLQLERNSVGHKKQMLRTYQASNSTPGRLPSPSNPSPAECDESAGKPCPEPPVLAQGSNAEDLHDVQEEERLGPDPFLNSQNPQPLEILPQCRSEPEHQMCQKCQGVAQNAFQNIYGKLNALTNQVQNVQETIKKKDADVDEKFKQVDDNVSSLLELVLYHDKRAQLSPSDREFPNPVGMDRGAMASQGKYPRRGARGGRRQRRGEASRWQTWSVAAQDVVHLVAEAEGPNSFSVRILPQTQMQKGLHGTGLDPFLDYLQSLHRPILVGFKIWTMGLLVLAHALKNVNKEERFKASVAGFLDVQPLLKNKIHILDSDTLGDLDRDYLGGRFCRAGPSGGAKIIKELCAVLEIDPLEIENAVVSYSILQYSPPSNLPKIGL